MHHNIDQPIALSFRDVTKVFNLDITALDKISFDVPTGQKLVLLGQSGSGKSTLLRHINRLQTPDSGDISVLNQPLSHLRNRQVRALRRHVGFIFQDLFLVGSMTVLENVCTGMLGSLLLPRMGVLTYPKTVRRRAIELLERVGIADKAFQRTDHLSGGQQQRVAIARALIQNPAILLADEPVASLDPESAHEVLELISTICREDELTVVMSLHQVNYALEFADRIVGLRSGEVVLDAAANQLSQDQVMAIYKKVIPLEELNPEEQYWDDQLADEEPGVAAVSAPVRSKAKL